MNKSEDVRKRVSQAYGEAVQRESCCTGGAPEQKGVAVKSAGYSEAELKDLPQEAVVNAFGCGNPVAFRSVQAGEVVVDLGSGAGLDLLLASEKVGPQGRVIGVDMTDEMLAKAQENITQAGVTNAEVRKGIIEKLPIEPETADWIISNCVINLSPEKSKVFTEIYRVLKPGGKISISDVMVRNLPEWVREDQKLYNSCVAGAISEDDYIQGMKEAGLTNIRVDQRLVYTPEQIQAIVESECCGDDRLPDGIEKSAMDSLQGKIWSAKIYAEKPR